MSSDPISSRIASAAPGLVTILDSEIGEPSRFIAVQSGGEAAGVARSLYGIPVDGDWLI